MEKYHPYFGPKPESREEVLAYAEKLANQYQLPEGAKTRLMERAKSVGLHFKTGDILDNLVECLPGEKQTKKYSNNSGRQGASKVVKLRTRGRSGLSHTSRI